MRVEEAVVTIEQFDGQALQAALKDAVERRRRDRVREILRQLPPADAVDLLRELPPGDLASVVALLGEEELAGLLEQVDAAVAVQFLVKLSRSQAADVLEEMAPDDATDIVAELEPAQAEAILIEMEPAEADEIRELLAYPPDTAGGRMTPELVAILPDLTVDEALAALRRLASEVETIHYVYVVDAEDHLLGVLSLRSLVLAPPGTPISKITVYDPIKVRAEDDQEVAARLLVEHRLLAIPVVDAENRLLGIVTADDAADILEREFNEDYLRLAGTDAEAMERRRPVEVARLRLPWLLGTMGIELLAGLVIARFDAVLRQVILLASFMPVISAVSGNVGLQAAAIVVRGLDTGHVSLRHWTRQVLKELATSFLMALACGVVLGVIGAVWSRHLPFGLVIGGALLCSMVTAGFMGSVIPMLSKRLGFDPATTAGPFETAFQDVVGFAVFLWLASLLLHWLQ
jgi:magnesium transporter